MEGPASADILIVPEYALRGACVKDLNYTKKQVFGAVIEPRGVIYQREALASLRVLTRGYSRIDSLQRLKIR